MMKFWTFVIFVISECTVTPGGAQITTTTPEPFEEYNMTFEAISEDVLITPSFNFTLHNNPTLLHENNSHRALILNCTKHQSVELPDRGIPCLQDLQNCKKGFTFTLEIEFTKLDPVEITYILSSGVDLETAAGMGIYIQNNQLIFTVKQGFYHWTGKFDQTGKFRLNQWYKYEISWSLTNGIAVIIDGMHVIHETAWTPSPFIPTTNPVFIGTTAAANSTSCINVKDLSTWTVYRDVLVERGILQSPTSTSRDGSRTPLSTTPKQFITTTPYQIVNLTTTLWQTVSKTMSVKISTHHALIPDTTSRLISVRTFSWNLDSVIGNMVTGAKYNLTLHGAHHVKKDCSCLNFNSDQQWLLFREESDGCLLDPGQCAASGLTVQFVVRFNRLDENTYLLKSGGQQPNTIGLAIVYRYDRMHFVLSSSQFSWFASISKNKISLNNLHTLTVSWHMAKGIEVFVDNKLVSTSSPPERNPDLTFTTSVVYFGKQSSASPKIDFDLQSIKIWYAWMDLLVSNGIMEPPNRSTDLCAD